MAKLLAGAEKSLNWLRLLGMRPINTSNEGATPRAVSPIHQLLDSAGMPWREPRLVLEKQLGISKHPIYGDVINFTSGVDFVDGLIYPLSTWVLPQFSLAYPAIEFFGSIAYPGDSERENIERAAKQLAESLGHTPVAPRHNTIHCEWQFGAASVSLTTWPADMQRGSTPNNPAHKRDPRLAKSCYLNILTGFRPSPSPAERAWLDSFVPIRSIQIPGRIDIAGLANAPARQNELEFVREPGAELENVFGKLGLSADGAALIFCQAQLYVVPVADVVGFRAERMQPAKGPGGSSLQVECRTRYKGTATKRLTICSADGPDDLNELIREIAIAVGKPFSLGEYFDHI